MDLTVFTHLPYYLLLEIIKYDKRFTVYNGIIRIKFDINDIRYCNLRYIYDIMSFAVNSCEDSEDESIIVLNISYEKEYLLRTSIFGRTLSIHSNNIEYQLLEY